MKEISGLCDIIYDRVIQEDTKRQVVNKMNQKIPRWVSTLLWIVGIFFTASLLGSLISTYFKSKWTVPQKMVLAREQVQKKEMKKPFSDYRNEIQPMFGEVKKEPPKKKEPSKGSIFEEPEDPVKEINWDQVIPNAQQQMRLNGTMIGSDTAIAIINIQGKDLSLNIGQQVGSYTVDSILKNTVIFKKNSNEVVLSMNLSEGAPIHIASNVRRLPARAKQKPSSNLNDIVKTSGSKKIVDRRKFNALLNPPSKLAKDLKFIPNSKDDKPYGIKISYLKNNSFFTKLGLKAGDILVKANNEEIKSVEDSFKTYQMFRNEDHMTLEVDRNGQVVKIPIEFR